MYNQFRPNSSTYLEYQPQGNYFVSAVPPLSNTDLRLPGGKTRPFYYCLGVDSTIPFISLQGGGISQKIFSWGEMIEVPAGQTVTVKNESFMQGDISINAGHDYAAKPERISLPVNTKITNIAILGLVIHLVESLFPADTRRCRRAYLNFQIETSDDPINFLFTGKPVKHSFIGTDILSGRSLYIQQRTLSPFTLGGTFPLGYGYGDESYPMALTDQVHWNYSYFDFAPPTVAFENTLFFYVLEY